MSKNVTDRILLKTIHDHYYQDFCSFEKGSSSRSSKNYVPIDCEQIAKKLELDSDIVFGRLYYHLDKKHGYKQPDGGSVHLFSMGVGADRHVVHFPLLSAVVAELEQSYVRFTLPFMLSFIALLISVAGFILSNT